MDSKERARLRGMANTMEPVFQVGKGGISEALITQVRDALEAREMIKLKVLLETAPETPRELAEKIAEATEAEVVQVVGGSIVLFKENPELHGEKKPAKKPSKKPGIKPRRTYTQRPSAGREPKPEQRKAKAKPTEKKSLPKPGGHSPEAKPKRYTGGKPAPKPGQKSSISAGRPFSKPAGRRKSTGRP